MINVSDEFRELMRERTNFTTNAYITFADGSKLTLDESDFSTSGNVLVDGAGVSGLPLGQAVSRSIQIELFNDNDEYTELDFQGAEIALELKFELASSTETVELGIFTVLDPVTRGETITITAVDGMYRADKPYTSSITYPASVSAVFREACTNCGIPFDTAAFTNSSYVVKKPLTSDYTYRQVFGYIAMLAGGNARIDRHGKLQIKSWDFSWKRHRYISGGTFAPWTTGKELSGGTFAPWTTGTELSGGRLLEVDHTFPDWNELKVDTGDIEITGIRAAVGSTDDSGETIESAVLYGEEGYVLSLENPLFTGDEQNALNLIGDLIVGARFRKFDGEYTAYPLAEFMDSVHIADRKGNQYYSVITDIEFTFLGASRFANSAESVLSAGSTFSTPESKTIVAARKMVQAERTARETAMKQFEEMLANSSGFYSTDVKQSDGSTVRFIHNKPTIEESVNVIKVTGDAIGFSTDGGETYPYGVSIDGDTILKIISAEGINADWITAGAFSVLDDKGNVIFSADKDTNTVTFSAVDSIAATVADNKAEIDSQLSSLQSLSSANANDIKNVAQNLQDGTQDINENIQNLEQRVAAEITSARVDIDFTKEAIENGVHKVVTTTGVTLDENGLTVNKSGANTSTNVDEDGVQVRSGEEDVLVADSTGVNAINVTARQYLTVGTNARFEDYMINRTACFYIGE